MPMSIDGLLLSAMAAAIGLSLAALVVVGATLPSGRRGVTPPPVRRSGHTYACHCWRDPVRVTVRPPARRRRPPAATPARHAARAAGPPGPVTGLPKPGPDVDPGRKDGTNATPTDGPDRRNRHGVPQ